MTVTRVEVCISMLCEWKGQMDGKRKINNGTEKDKTRQERKCKERRREEIVLNVHFQCQSFLRQTCQQESLSLLCM